MSYQKLVKRLEVDLLYAYNHIYSSYIHFKSHKIPLPNLNLLVYFIMELVIMDLTGLISVLKKNKDVGTAVCDIVAIL